VVQRKGAVDTKDREIVFSRVFDAPPEVVFEAWTRPEHLARWWGPRGFTTTTHEMDFRPGGVWRLTMLGPDGVEYPNKIVYDEIVRPERIVYSNRGGQDGVPAQFQSTVTFVAAGPKTQLTMRLVFPSTEARDAVVTKYGAVEGGKQTLERLAEHLSSAPGADADLVLTRLLDAPRELAFSLWTEAERLARWWGPAGFTNPVCELDPRPGGAILVHMRGPDGVVYPMAGAFREIVPPERLVFTAGPLDADGKLVLEALNTVTFAAEGKKTRLTLRVQVLRKTAAAAPMLEGMEQGWTESLERLAALAATPLTGASTRRGGAG
jgi:uncharacterized protein YndB with AHSA1/START domain